jgi:hypothetical protein
MSNNDEEELPTFDVIDLDTEFGKKRYVCLYCKAGWP